MQGHHPRGQGRTYHILEEMRRAFPVLQDFQPLASGIEDSLAAHFPRDPAWRVIAALRRHVQDSRYLRAIIDGEARYDLNGEVRSYISEGERHHAQRLLRERGEEAPGGKTGAKGGPPADEGKEEGLRLLIALQSAHRFGSGISQEVQPYLEALESEDALTEAGVRLLDAASRQEWLAYLREAAS
jgi:ProP effector